MWSHPSGAGAAAAFLCDNRWRESASTAAGEDRHGLAAIGIRKDVHVSDPDSPANWESDWTEHEDGDLTDLLGELRVLLPGAQTLTAFLIILPFNAGFTEIKDAEKGVYIVTFLCSVVSLICFTAPAAHHRLQRPLRNREAFKTLATRLIIAGLVPLSFAIVLASQLVISSVVAAQWVSWVVAGAVALVILVMWWLIPIAGRGRATSGPARQGRP